MLGFFMRSVESRNRISRPLNLPSLWMDGIVHYRVLPGGFPRGTGHQFDGAAAVMSLRFENERVTEHTQHYRSARHRLSGRCRFYGIGVWLQCGW